MKKLTVTLLLLILSSFGLYSQTGVPVPEKFFGFQPGADRQLMTYEQLIDYFKALDAASDKLALVQIGTSPMGKSMYMALISDAENIKNIDRLKEINRQLALNYNLTEKEKDKLVTEGKVFVYATLSMHANEVGPAQASPLIAYDLVTAQSPEVTGWLKEVVYMMVPCHNPDGMDMVVNNYLKYRGTKYEGASLPGVYHKYVGHDNNRDFITLSQTDTKAIAKVYNLDWFPQVMFEKHQMGSTGVRYFVPPPHDPIAENIDAGLWNWMSVFGSNMIKDMTKDSLKGVAQSYIFDDYWPGSTETCLWKNVIAMLTECAGTRYATPIYLEPTELSVRGKGLSEYKKSINMPDPWPGGWWRLSDIVQYEISSTNAILRTAAANKEAILAYRNDLCKKEVSKGKNEPPYYYILPLKQHDPSELVDLVHILQEQGIDVFRLTSDITLDNCTYRKGDVVIPLAQPYRPFIKEVMESQTFPVRHYTPDGKIIRPYDITTWSLPLHKGLVSKEVTEPYRLTALEKLQPGFTLYSEKSVIIPEKPWGLAFSSNENESYKTAFLLLEQGKKVYRLKQDFNTGDEVLPAGTFVVQSDAVSEEIFSSMKTEPVVLEREPTAETEPVSLPHIALIESWFHDMDAGWTRFIFDKYHIPYTVIRPGAIANTDLSQFGMVVFPDMSKSVLMSGKYSESGYYQPSYPPEYTQGIGTKGMEKLMQFENDGGKIISWGRSTDLFAGTLTIQPKKGEAEHFVLPFRNIGKALAKKGLYCPGTLVKVHWKPGHPLTFGMQSQTGIFYRGNPVFTTSVPIFDMDRRVIGWFPEEKNPVMSGYAEHIELVTNKSAMLWLRKGKGDMILFAFSPIFRASTPVTYKLLFNALLL